MVTQEAQKNLLLAALLFSASANAMNCLKKYTKHEDSPEKHGIHIHMGTPTNKKGVFLTVLTISSALVGIGINISSAVSSAPTYEIQHATPYNSSITPSISYADAYADNHHTQQTIICEPKEIDYYSTICQHHDNNSTKLSKRLLRDIARIKRDHAQADRNGACTTACAKTDNPQDCTDLAIRDNAVIVKTYTGHKNNSSGDVFGLNIGTLSSQILTTILIAYLGTMASGCT